MALKEPQLRKWQKQARETGTLPKGASDKRVNYFGASDGGGLTFTLSRTGTASWVFRYRHAGKAREMTFGNYPDMPLEKAREAARAARVMVDLGKDVAGEKRRAKAEAAAARTFREVAQEYLAQRKTIAPRTRHDIERYLAKDIYPAIGNVAIGDVSVDEIRVLVKRIASRSQSVARRAFEIISVLFAHAIGDGALTRNPIAELRVSSLVGEPQPRRSRVKLERDELTVLLRSSAALGKINELCVKILLATCVRKGELIRAKKADVDLDKAIWTVPDENSKTGSGYLIPLAPAVVGWFRELISYSGDSQWVLPARNGKGRFERRHMHERTLNAALARTQFGIRAFSPHDLRSTARSYLTAQSPMGCGVSIIVAERCLNHSLGGLVAVYDKHDYLDERRVALEKWANLLVELETGKPQNIVALRAAA